MRVQREERRPEHEHVEEEVDEGTEETAPVPSSEDERVGVLDGSGDGSDPSGDTGMARLKLRGEMVGAVGDPDRRDEDGGSNDRRQDRKRQIVLAGEDPEPEQDTERDQRERVDRRVEEAEVELALGDRLHRQPAPVQQNRTGADPRKRPCGNEQATAELRPGEPSVEPPAPSFLLEHALGVDDLAPGDHVSDLRDRLEPERGDQPQPADAFETAQRLRQARDEPQQQEREHAERQQPERELAQVVTNRSQGVRRVVGHRVHDRLALARHA